ncbi:sodium/hydrogen exchanger 9B2-like isoform X3 [Planococcus citri]|uniref:sodium/hydrogen exchanger 9B2-like isoform X3 n=1 Tax=Planococcus citri TaxID=170843 RepID=UPI0031F7D03B
MKFNTTDDGEKGASIELSKKTRNDQADVDDGVSVDSAQTKSYLSRLLANPCGDNPKGIDNVTLILGALLTWAFLYTILREEVEPPGGQLFKLILLMVLSQFCGWLISFLHLPPLLGMLLCGIALRNVGFFHLTGVYTDIVVSIRSISLGVILLKAGLGLDASALKRLSFVVARLALLPCLVETAGIAAAAYLLMNMSWTSGVLLGFALASVSPAVVVPSLLVLKEKGYGENKGISTLVIAASTIDNITSISGFGVVLKMLFSPGDLLSNILQGPLEVLIGLVVGLGWGFISACIPHRNENHLVVKRSIMVGGGGLVCVLGGQMFGYSGSGTLAAIISSFLASLCWKWQGWSNNYNPVGDIFGKMWLILQPLFFGLIGTEVKLNAIDVNLVLQGTAIIGFGLLVRSITCGMMLFGAKLNLKEVFFVILAWLPKATVQAALGPLALDMAKKTHQDDAIPWAQNILTIAILSIVITAPIGAVGISVGGPKLLSNQPPNKKYPNELPVQRTKDEERV